MYELISAASVVASVSVIATLGPGWKSQGIRGWFSQRKFLRRLVLLATWGNICLRVGTKVKSWLNSE